MKVLITGGAGYIGSTTASACLDAGHEVVVVDDFSTGRPEFVADRVHYEGDFADRGVFNRITSEHEIDVVIHCAARILVPESVTDPLTYYENNVGKTIDLLHLLGEAGINRFVFSSSASIYAPDENFEVNEDSPLAPASPYARTKAMMEQILEDTADASELKVLSLRYFNPVGTDPQLRTGQQIEHPSHVMGKLLDAWLNNDTFTVTGVDWPTRDGSGIRDFIHVWDLALAHVAAVDNFDAATADQSYQVINIGTGNGTTVKELAAAFEEGAGRKLNIAEGAPRPGDVAGVCTVSDKAERMLGWTPKHTMVDSVRDAIAWIPRRKEMLGF